MAKGAPADRIETVGVGGESPLVPNLGPANQAKNRRVELVVVSSSAVAGPGERPRAWL